ncbi:F-box/FBD/LRR-repeat protein At1g78750-like [Vicia villosa]|uniref:F-box/FBD/LRR-repeat protein At1g78750-like n=1 Tax=Vicia villosa TaxID=3911 RepID=UPI00273B997A|nr:F-box/FBD/LRR-repeat protein At1g78750-like [Vicia villosa]
MAEESKSKQGKPKGDRMSSLSDTLLIRILSFLPSKTSVQTSILSPRWRNLWKHLSVLNLSDEDFIQFNSEPFKNFRRFFYFVNSIIFVLKLSQVQNVRLSCTKSFTGDTMCRASFNAWMISVIGPSIKELDLTLFTLDGYCCRLPVNLSVCTNLVSLSLKGALCFELSDAKSSSLPSLKKLRLDISPPINEPSLSVFYRSISPMTVASLNDFFHACPCLETLDLYFSLEDYDRICVPALCLPFSLKRLKIVVNNSDKTQVLLLDNLSISDAGKLQKASLYASNASPSTLSKLLHALSGIKHININKGLTLFT